MRRLQKLLLVTFIPISLITYFAYFLGNSNDILDKRIHLFVVVYFINIGLCYTFLYDYIFSNKKYWLRILGSVVVTFFISFFILKFIYLKILIIYTGKQVITSIQTIILQSILSSLILLIIIAIDYIYYKIPKNYQHLFYNPLKNYFYYAFSISFPITLFFLLINREVYKNIEYSLIFISLVKLFLLFYVTLLINFLIYFIYSKISFIQSRMFLQVGLNIVLGLLFFLIVSRFWSVYNLFKFPILPFVFIFLLMSIFSMIYLYKLDEKHKNTTLQLQYNKTNLEYNLLKQQVNPHFLFNNLNVLIALIDQDTNKAKSFGNHLANVYRHLLAIQKENFILLSKELLFIENYLLIYKTKFESRFTYTINVDSTQENYILSSVLIEVIDNFFKHNNLDENQKLLIEIYCENNYLIIKNNKNNKNVISNKSGLQNINSRYKLLTNKEITIEDNTTIFIVKIPILNENSRNN